MKTLIYLKQRKETPNWLDKWRGEKISLYELTTHAKQNYLDLKNGPPPIHSSTQRAYLTSLFKAAAIKNIFIESLNTSKYIHYVHSDIALKGTV